MLTQAIRKTLANFDLAITRESNLRKMREQLAAQDAELKRLRERQVKLVKLAQMNAEAKGSRRVKEPIHGVVFSKDRPLQLYALLESYLRLVSPTHGP